MASTFGCPECGQPIALPPAAAGRRVRCAECLTLVEVPFFSRSKPKRRRDRATGWAWVAIAFGLAVIAAAGTYLLVRDRVREERHAALDRLVATVERAERAGEYASARSALDQAIAFSATFEGPGGARLETLRALGERIDVSAREAAIESAAADLTVVRDLLGRADFDAARALGLATRAFETARKVADPRAESIEGEAREAASGLVRGRGVRFRFVSGSTLFDAGKANAEQARRLRPLLAVSLRCRGYLPEPEESPLSPLWEDLAPYSVTTAVEEVFGPAYLQSPNRTARIEAVFSLDRAGEALWRSRVVAKTRVPSPAFSAFESGYLGVSPRREPEIERKLYVDALDDLVEETPSKLDNLPAWAGG